MRLWFYVKDGQQHGPIAEDVLLEMLKVGTLSLDTLVWAKELKNWTTARDVEELVPADISLPPIASLPIPKTPWTPPVTNNIYQPSGSQLRPWLRYWARTTDICLFGLLFGIVSGIIYPPVLKIHEALLTIILLFAYIFVEPILLSSWGTTPGKAILRIRVRQQDGTKLNFSQGINRGFRIWLFGWGLGLPIISLVTLITSYRRLNREGITTWDRDGHLTVCHQIVGPFRTVVTILGLIAFCALIVIGEMEG